MTGPPLDPEPVGLPAAFVAAGPPVRRPAPASGEHDDEVAG
jgi:hypothetical protein